MDVALDDIYKAMADEHRRKILTSLCHQPRVAGELGELVGLAPNAVSFHLKWLRTAGLVSVQREGRFLRYRANPEPLMAWSGHVTNAFRPATTASIRPGSRESSQEMAALTDQPEPRATDEEAEPAWTPEDTLPPELL